MTTENYVSLETAKLLMEKGFDEVCFKYALNGEIYNNGDFVICHVDDVEVGIPTLQTAIKWLRKEKGFHIFAQMEIDYDEDERGNKWYHNAAYYPEIIRVSDGKIMYDDGSLYAEPEQAYEVAIKYCLEKLI